MPAPHLCIPTRGGADLARVTLMYTSVAVSDYSGIVSVRAPAAHRARVCAMPTYRAPDHPQPCVSAHTRTRSTWSRAARAATAEAISRTCETASETCVTSRVVLARSRAARHSWSTASRRCMCHASRSDSPSARSWHILPASGRQTSDSVLRQVPNWPDAMPPTRLRTLPALDSGGRRSHLLPR